MKIFDVYIRSVYFEKGKVGMLKLSTKHFLFGIINLPLLVIWSVWKGISSN